MACRLKVVVPSRASRKGHSRRKRRQSRRKRAGYSCEYKVSRFELFDFVNRENGRVKVYSCGKHREYSVSYPAKRLLLNPVSGSGAIPTENSLHVTCMLHVLCMRKHAYKVCMFVA